MKIFIRYSSFKSLDRLIPISLPARYARIVNLHWDASCRPDPDFDPEFPSTGICRSPTIQNFISRNRSQNIKIYYFYTFTQKNIKFIAITAKLTVQDVSQNHQNAFLWLINKNRTANNIPLNIVVDSVNNYRNCITQAHSKNTIPDVTYHQRSANKFIHFSWSCNKTSHPITLKEIRFVNVLKKRNATLINSNNKFNSLNQLQNSAIVIQ